MHDLYDWFADIWLPAFAGIGSIAVGAVAIVVARQSHKLAVQVRRDEGQRDEDGERARYRDQLFRTVEPAVTAFLDQRAHLIEVRRTGTLVEQNLLSNGIARLRLILAVVNDHDRPFVVAILKTYREMLDHQDWAIRAAVIGGLAVQLPGFLAPKADIPELIEELEKLLPETVANVEQADDA